MVGAAGVVAGTLASIGTEEHTASINDTFSQLFVVLDLQDEMLWCIEVREVNHLVDGIDKHVAAVFQCFGSHLLARQQLQLSVNLGLYFVQFLFRGGNEEYL